MFQTVTSQLRILMVSPFYCGSIFYNKSVTQNVYFIFSLKKLLRVQKILYIRQISCPALGVLGAEVKTTEGEQVTICFLCRE